MSVNPKTLSKLLESIANALDISDSNYEQAVKRYEEIGAWLKRNDSIVACYNPEIYAQGSIVIGTVTKPVSDAEEYDLDLVSELNIRKDRISQKDLKTLVGFEIKRYASNHNINSPVEEGKRCWTLNCADGARFHIDILPAIPDAVAFKRRLESKGYSVSSWSDTAIAITDNTLPNYSCIDLEWPRSNPKGYAAWFRSRMEIEFNSRRKIIAESNQTQVEKVPDYKVKTPLQRAIQILKRHRDIMFARDPDDKPISIILTTLAGHAYKNQTDILDTLKDVVMLMPRFIQRAHGVTWIPNPVDPLENFADKWQEHPQRERKFYTWLRQAQQDLEKVFKQRDIASVLESLKPCLGERIVNEIRRNSSQSISGGARTRATSIPRDPSRFHIPHRQVPPWLMKPGGWVGITCKASPEKSTPHRTEVLNDSPPLPKSWQLQFQAQTDVPQPYKVYWQVVNTGSEAQLADDLRGDFYEDNHENGRDFHEESTKYRGMHWIECFIVKDGICWARSGEFVVNIQ